jgi:hypothetical protein
MINEIGGFSKPFKPFPGYADRAAWEAPDGEIKAFYHNKAQELKNYRWPQLPAVRYLDYFRNGDRQIYENLFLSRRRELFFLLMAECMEAKGEYLNDIINGVWHICEETAWIYPAHTPPYKDGSLRALPDIEEPPCIDLMASETVSLMAWVYCLLGDVMAPDTPVIKRRIELEAERRVLTPYLERDDHKWMGFNRDYQVNNWNSWVNSNVLAAFLVFHNSFPRYMEGVNKCIRSLNRLLSAYTDDGGCDEGPYYFGKAAGCILDFIEELGEVSDVSYLYRNNRIRNMASYITRIWAAKDYYVNYADGEARSPNIPVRLLARTAEKTEDENLGAFAAYIIKNGYSPDVRKPVGHIPFVEGYHFYRLISDILKPLKPVNKLFVPPDKRWFPGIQVVIARDGREGLFFSAKGGRNNESHNHNDVGSFVLYCHGNPVIVDAGREAYSRETFREKRYTFWVNRSSWHNVPVINGCEQLAGETYRAKDTVFKTNDDGTLRLSMDISGAYPAEGGIKSWERTFIFDPAKGLTLTDRYSFGADKGSLELVFLCREKPVIGEGKALLGGGTVVMEFDPAFTAGVEEKSFDDVWLTFSYPEGKLWRLGLKKDGTGPEGEEKVYFKIADSVL